MADFTAVSDVGRTIVELLRSTCCPPVEKPEFIGLCSPTDGGNFSVGICLYDIDENTEMRSRREVVVDATHTAPPPYSINLYYMFYAALKSDVNGRAADEQRILGRVFQQLGDNRVINGSLLRGSLAESDEGFTIVYENKTLDEKLKIWSAYGVPPRPALFYKVSSLLINSTRIRETKRVTEADVTLRQKNGSLIK